MLTNLMIAGAGIATFIVTLMLLVIIIDWFFRQAQHQVDMYNTTNWRREER